MEEQEDNYTKSELSNNIKCQTELENDGVNNTEFPVTIKNEFKKEMFLPEDNPTNEDSKDWFNQMNTAIYIENVKHEEIEDDSNLLNCKIFKSEPNIKEEEDVIEANQSQCGSSEEEIHNDANSDLNSDKRFVGDDTKTVDNSFNCEICSKPYSLESNLRRHMKWHDGEEKPLVRETVHLPFQKISCETCSKQFSTDSELKFHTRIHTEEKLFTCDVCSKGFCNNSSLKAHMRRHTKELFPCDMCPKQFLTNYYLKIHMRRHTGDRPFHCELCPKRFTRKCALTSHIKCHTRDVLFTCEVCNKQFVTKAELTRHTRTHTGEKPFSCEVCCQRFVTKRSLTNHMIIHTEGLSFSCEICNKPLSNNRSLANHMNSYGRKHIQIEVCFKGFAQSSMLEEHMADHTSN